MHQQSQLPQPPPQQQQTLIQHQQQLMQQQQHNVMQPGVNANVPSAGATPIPQPMMYHNPQQSVTVAQQPPQQVAVASSVSQLQQPVIAIQQPQQLVTDNNPYLPASRLKLLLPELKQALSVQALLKVVAESSKYHLSSLESASSTNESTSVAETFNKEAYRQASEHFWSICDQMEQCFALLIEGERQQAFMNFFLPVTVNTSGVDRSDDSTAGPPSLPNRMTLQYPQFIIAVKKQIDYSRTVCERLNELSNSISAIRNNACHQ